MQNDKEDKVQLFDLKKETSAAFRGGFIKGLAAPAMLFSGSDLPKVKPVPNIKLEDIIPPDGLKKDAEALYGDFVRALNKTL